MRKPIIASLVAVTALAGCTKHSNQSAADNTARNKRDPVMTPTADNAMGQTTHDRDTTQAIRKLVVDDKTLSTNAHNCKIVVQTGVVTLVGPVDSAAESAALERIASSVVGDNKVINQLEVITTKG